MPLTSSLSTVATPRVVVELPRLRRNIAAMQTLAAGAGVRLRPHAKTHKSPVIARWQIEAGAVGVCCAKLGEAEVFADAGIDDIRLPYPINPANATRVLALVDRTRLSIIVDDLEVARQWSAAVSRAGRTLDVLVKIDVGFHRCGLDPDSPHTVQTIARLAELPGLRFRGLLSHAGHAYIASSADEIDELVEHETVWLNDIATELRQGGTPVEEVSVGSTPTARLIGRQAGVTEMRPGNYVFYDRTQAGLGAAALDTCALTVIATVVSRPAADRVIFDAGSKTLTTDSVRGFGTPVGYGLVYPAIGASEPDESLVIERLSEEHATARVPETCALKPGDRVRILPNHACVVTNLADELLLADGDAIVGHLPVAARGRNT